MSTFDSPVGRCEAVREMVLLDETQQQCAREHDCPPGRRCPLEGWFRSDSDLCGTRLEDLAPLVRPRTGVRPTRD